MRRTRLIATLGPATETLETIQALVDAGTDTFRLNMSHATHDWARTVSGYVREAAAHAPRGRPVGLLFDLQGPSIRTGAQLGDRDGELPLDLELGDMVEFRHEGSTPTLSASTTVNYPSLVNDVSIGDTLLVDNPSRVLTGAV